MARFHSKMAHRLPKLWLFTDERVTDTELMAALMRLPRGSGIVFRHYRLPEDERRQLFKAIRAVARRRRLRLVLADDPRRALAWNADGWHGRKGIGQRPKPGLLHSAPAHDRRELGQAQRAGADLAFLSPAFSTRSHPGEPALGPLRFALLCRQVRMPVMALGGMTRDRARRLTALGAAGWGAIDALSK